MNRVSISFLPLILCRALGDEGFRVKVSAVQSFAAAIGVMMRALAMPGVGEKY